MRAVPMLDLGRQYGPIRDEILAALGEVLDSREFILGGPALRFERAAALALGVGHAAGCSSGTDALWLALAALGIGPGDQVVTTPFSFFASVSSILRTGARPLLADIDPVTFNLDPEAVEAVLGGGGPVRAILPVHLFGQCADWTRLSSIAGERGLALIEDAAQAWGAEWRGIRAGGLGDLAAFSFYPTKNLSAAGDAGLVTTSSPRLDERVRMLRQHGMRTRYYHEETGANARLDGLQAAVLSVKLRYIDGWNQARRAAAGRYHALLHAAGVVDPGPYPERGVVLPVEVPGSRHAWHQYVIRVAGRDRLRAGLAARGIGSEIYYPVPLHLQRALAGLGYAEGSLPEAERAAGEVLALPLFPELAEEEQEIVVDAIRALLA